MEPQMGMGLSSRLIRLLCYLWLCSQTLCVSSAANSNQSSAANTGQQPQPQPLQLQQTGCDLLFMVGDNLANYCHCKEAAAVDSDLAADSAANLLPDNSGQLVQINLLSCSPNNFSQIIRDLYVLQLHKQTSSSKTTLTFQIDYLNINTTLTSRLNFPIPIGNQRNSSPAAAAAAANLMLIDHISIQLNSDLHCTSAHNDDDDDQLTIEQQMIDFSWLINETHLQFLSIFLGPQNVCDRPTGSGDALAEFRLARLLARLSGLARLEVSLSQPQLAFLLSSDCFRHQRQQLRWLNLASNAQLRFVYRDDDDNDTNQSASDPSRLSPFALTPGLEYLSLEANHLESFALFSLLAAAPFKFHSNTYYGLANLSSLNLASNKLASFERDLFTQLPQDTNVTTTTSCHAPAASKHDTPARLFLLPALTQLDLSSNRLSELTFKAAQHLLCSMPNLNQLFLQRNRILHLNLNALLAFPPPQINLDANSSAPLAPYPLDMQKHSRLEYIDLSHNNLLRVSAIQQQQQQRTPMKAIRVKTIDLSHNNLRLPLLPVDPTLLNKVVFADSFDTNHFFEWTNSTVNSLNLLESSFTVNDNSSWMSLCDFLSPEAGKKQTGIQDFLSTSAELLNEVILSNNQLTRLAKSDFGSQQCKDLQVLRLAQNQIGSIERESFGALINLEQLDLSFNHLSNLFDDTFVKNRRLKTLNLSGNRLRSLSREIFFHLLELEEMFLQENELFTISNELFLHNRKINIVNLSNNKLTALDKSTFAYLDQLRVLNLHDNHLKRITHHLFEPAAHVKPAILDRNELKALPQKPNANSLKQPTAGNPFASNRKSANFKSHKSKTQKRTSRQVDEVMDNNVLILAHNQVDQFRFESCDLRFTSGVQILWLNDNRLKDLSESSFKCFRSLQRLYLANNRLRSIERTLLKQLNQLEYLDLSRNQLISIQDGACAHSSNLRNVDLSQNLLSELNPLALFTTEKDEDIVQIESLNLSDNFNLNLQCRHLYTFLSRIALRRIQLDNIKRVVCQELKHNSTFRERLYLEIFSMSSSSHLIEDSASLEALEEPMIVIEKLNLSFNTLPGDKLRSLVRSRLTNELVEVNLSGNQLNGAQVIAMFQDLPGHYQLSSLNLSSNLIDQWPFNSSSANKMSKLRSLDLSKNEIRQFIKGQHLFGLELRELESLNLSSNSLTVLIEKQQAGEMNGLNALMPRLKEVDLSHNRLTWIPDSFFSHLTELTHLRLDHNLLETFLPEVRSHRLVLDISFNHKLYLLPTDKSEKHGHSEDSVYSELLDDVILLRDQHQAPTFGLKCFTTSDYITAQRFIVPISEEFEGYQTETMYQGEHTHEDDRCEQIVKRISSLKLDSTSSHLNIDQLPRGRGYLHVSLRSNSLAQVIINAQNYRVVVLDLAQNKLQVLPKSICQSYPMLVSLELGENHLTELPENVLSCPKLQYLDLSFNNMKSLRLSDTSDEIVISSVRILKLDHNLLKHFNLQDLQQFRDLRFLDLRHNQLQLIQPMLLMMKRSSPFIIASDFKYSQETNVIKPILRGLAEGALIVEVPTTLSNKFALNLYEKNNDSSYLSEHKEANKHLIRLCSLKNESSVQVCLKSLAQDVEDRCLYLRRPFNVPLCLTSLQEAPKNDSGNTNLTVADSSKLMSNVIDSSSRLEEDPVLSFIDVLKQSWLKLKDFNMNQYLSSLSDIREDSVWIKVAGKYPIYTLSVVKLAMVCGSICIIALLIAMFTLLTYFSSPNQERMSDKQAFQTSEGDGTTDTDTSRSSTTTNNKSSMSNDSVLRTQSSFPSSKQTSSSGSSTSNGSKDDTQQQTVIEIRKSHTCPQQLDANQLVHLQPSSTPSSSIAPSSIETAETLQAIDSIQSGNSIYNNSNAGTTSIDQYSDHLGAAFVQQQPQVATVMRMVKSNSANFDSAKHPSASSTNLYGTLNSRYSNCSSLKSKIRALQEHQQQAHQLYSTNPHHIQQQQQQHPVMAFYSQDQLQQVAHNHPAHAATSYNAAQDVTNSHYSTYDPVQQQEIDPTTMSLLSINSAISGNFAGSSAPHQMSLNSMNSSKQVDQFSTSNNLCNYHRYSREPSDHFSSDVILEQEEEQQAGLNLMLVANLPPPPPSRAIEAIESNNLQYLAKTASAISDKHYHN